MGRKIEVPATAKEAFNFSKQFLRPRKSGAHGTCHACHTLDTPLTTGNHGSIWANLCSPPKTTKFVQISIGLPERASTNLANGRTSLLRQR